MRKYLNSEFYNSFTQSEQLHIAESKIITPNNPWYGKDGGKDTIDKIFLLSIEEVVKYFGDSGKLRSPSLSKFSIDDRYSQARIALALDANATASWWWLRSAGRDSGDAAAVSGDGDVSMIGLLVGSAAGGVRPALWLNL